ncbi:MAG: FAD:protein FMN transferase [Luteolibacter sp.]|uniref:FAD:protein FMN transferase n=1 Tax=Luteolibacter sp. TaxID=1962973 RepID=UPI003266E6CA
MPLQADSNGVRHLEFKALGTNCSVKFRQADDRTALAFASDALGWIGNFEAKFSRFRPDSIVSRVNAAAGGDWIEVDDEMEHMLKLADDLHARTNGILDPTLLPLQRIWDWKTVHLKLPTAAEVKAALALTGWKKVQRRPGAVRLPETGMGLDFGGFGKEYAVDYLARMAGQCGITDALIDLGRDIFALGGNGIHPFWHIGIEDGCKTGTCWGGLAVTDHAVSASGDYARYFTHQGIRYGHILDPRTGWPVSNGMRAVTVVAPSCLEAGVYSTAVFVLGAREGLHLASLARGVEVCAQSESGIEGSRAFGKWLVKAA